MLNEITLIKILEDFKQFSTYVRKRVCHIVKKLKMIFFLILSQLACDSKAFSEN